MRKISVIILSLLTLSVSKAQSQLPTVKLLESGKKISMRGLSVVDDNTVWVSGSGGSVARSLDGGATWTWIKVPGYEKTEFRDIEAFDDTTAVIMAISEPAIILKTKDGGKTWKKVFEDTRKGMFLDAMDFRQEGKAMPIGIVVGDPIDNRLFYAYTIDGGDTWKANEKDSSQLMETGEAMFASSGTNVKFTRFTDENDPPVLLVTGGTRAGIRDISSASKRLNQTLSLTQGIQSTGANSIAVNSAEKKAVIVGGDFAKDSIATGNCVLVSFGKKKNTYTVPKTFPHGYRSCVIYIDHKTLITCGTSGIDISRDGGKHWTLVSKDSFHVCQKAKNGNAVFLAGNGRIAKLLL